MSKKTDIQLPSIWKVIILSLTFPGAGHLYLREWWRGAFAILLTCIFSILLIVHFVQFAEVYIDRFQDNLNFADIKTYATKMLWDIISLCVIMVWSLLSSALLCQKRIRKFKAES